MTVRPQVAALPQSVGGRQFASIRSSGLRVLAAGVVFVCAHTPMARSQDLAGSDTVHVDTLVAMPSDTAVAPPMMPNTAETSLGALAAPSDILPFAGNAIPMSYPAVGVALGYAHYFSSFKGIEDAFHAIEDSIRTGSGFVVPAAAGPESVRGILLTFTLRFNPALEAACQVARTGDDNNEVRLIGGLVSGHYALTMVRKVSVFGGLGGGRYGVHFARNYGVPLTPTDPTGGHIQLDNIKLDGGGGYWTTAGGVTIHADPHLSLEGLIQYFGMSDVPLDAGSAGRISTNASGVLISGSFILYF